MRKVVFVGALALLALTTIPAHANWAQWRGPDGLGISIESHPLPTTWEPQSSNIRWRAAIEGEGNSSPIVSNGRVFVTTAYEGSAGAGLAGLLSWGAVALALIFLVLAVRGGQGASGSRVLIVGSVLFIGIAILANFAPQHFYTLGNPGRVWRVTGGIALLGLAAAVGWFSPNSRWRLFGALLVLGCAAALIQWTPYTPLGRASFGRRITMLVPAIAMALWYLIRFVKSRRNEGGGLAPAPMLAAPLVVLSVLVFYPANYMTTLLRVVVCMDLESGEVLWEKAALAAPPEKKWDLGTFATPTPVTDGELLYAYFGAGIVAMDLDGNEVWARQFPDYVKQTRYGAAASPVLFGDAVILVAEQEANQEAGPSWMAAFDKRSGKTLWRIEPGEAAHDSYSTPLLYQVEGTSQLLTPSWELLVSYDASSGERLWSVSGPMQQMVASMARADDVVAVSGGIHGDKALMVLRVAPDGSGAELLWETTRGVAAISSPILHDGLLYSLTENGIMICYDAETGEVRWKHRLEAGYYASLVLGDGKVYAITVEGSTSVVAASPEFELLAVNDLQEAVYATPAIADGCLLVRTAGNLFCIEGADV